MKDLFSQAISPANIALTGIIIAIVALLVSLINAAIAIWDFYLSRFALIKVRKIRTYASQSVRDPQGSIYFEVEVLNCAATVWDIAVEVIILTPLRPKFARPGFMRTYTLNLTPVGEGANQLNRGQGLKFEMKRPLNTKQMFLPPFDEIAADIPHRNISLCIYTGKENETRTLLKRIRSRQFHWQIDTYMNRVFRVNPYWWNRIHTKASLWWLRRQNAKFDGWMKQQRQNNIDQKNEQLR